MKQGTKRVRSITTTILSITIKTTVRTQTTQTTQKDPEEQMNLTTAAAALLCWNMQLQQHLFRCK